MENEASKNTTEWITVFTAILTLVNVIATIVYVIFTIRIASFSRKATEISQEAIRISQNAVEISRKQLEKVAELEESRVRPYVLFSIFSDEDGRTYSHIKNYGLTAAFNVQVTITPELKVFETDELDTLSSNLIKMLPPNYEIRSVIDITHKFHEAYPESKFEGFIDYENDAAKKIRDSFSLDLSFLKRRFRAKDKILVEEVESISEKLERISREIKALKNEDLK